MKPKDKEESMILSMTYKDNLRAKMQSAKHSQGVRAPICNNS